MIVYFFDIFLYFVNINVRNNYKNEEKVLI